MVPNGVPEATLARKGYLYVLADGIGGHQAGNVASQVAVDVIRRVYYEDTALDPAVALQRAILAANAEIYRQGQADPACADMGSTVVAVVLRGTSLTVANVGDSRAYLLRGRQQSASEGSALQRLTADHTWVAERVASGMLTPQDATRHEMRNVVTRSLGNGPTVRVDVRTFTIQPGDRVLLCCDGVWHVVPEAEFPQLIGRGRPQVAADALVKRAISAGGTDDTTAVVIATATDPWGLLAWGRALWAQSPQWIIAGGSVGLVGLLVLLVSLSRPVVLTRPPVATRQQRLDQSPATNEASPSDSDSPAEIHVPPPTAMPSPFPTMMNPSPTLSVPAVMAPPLGYGIILYDLTFLFRDPYQVAYCRLRQGERVAIWGATQAIGVDWYEIRVPTSSLVRCNDPTDPQRYKTQDGFTVGYVHASTVDVERE
jgi:serine/threonine protein phosphatase PrpC